MVEGAAGNVVEHASSVAQVSEVRKAELVAAAVTKARAAQQCLPSDPAKLLNYLRTRLLKRKVCEREGIGSADLQAMAERVRQAL